MRSARSCCCQLEVARQVPAARGPLHAALLVVVDDVFQRGEGAVVHVGRGPGQLAQRRRLERIVGGAQVDLLAAALVGARQADVVEVAVGEGKAGMAADAAALAGEQLQAADLRRRERFGVTCNPAVEARRRGYERALVGGQGARDGAGGDRGVIRERPRRSRARSFRAAQSDGRHCRACRPSRRDARRESAPALPGSRPGRPRTAAG